MWLPWEGIEIDDQRARAAFGRHLQDGRHVYPTATLRLPTSDSDRHCWRVRVNSMRNGIAIGAKSSQLEDGKVFGREESVGLVWWLSNSGELNNGGSKLPTVEQGDATGTDFPATFRFKAGDVVEVLLDRLELSYTVNGRAWTAKLVLKPPTGHTRKDFFALSVQMLDRGDEVELLDSHPNAILEAELLKQCHSTVMMGRWQPKWFVLTARTLLYRPGRQWRAGKILELSGVKSAKGEGDTILVLVHEKRTFRLRCGSEAARNAWLDAVRGAVSNPAALPASKSFRVPDWRPQPKDGGESHRGDGAGHDRRSRRGTEGGDSSRVTRRPGDPASSGGDALSDSSDADVDMPDAPRRHHSAAPPGGAASPTPPSLPADLRVGAAAEAARQRRAEEEPSRMQPAGAGAAHRRGGAGEGQGVFETAPEAAAVSRGGSSPGVHIPRLETLDPDPGGPRPASAEPVSTTIGGKRRAWDSFKGPKPPTE